MVNFKIGEMAAAAGVGRDTIRYYERSGLLAVPDRTAAGYRLYTEADLERLNFIRSAQELGFTLDQVRQLLAVRASDTATATAVLEITLAKISEAETRIEQLSNIRDILRELAGQCPGELPTSECPILAFLATKRAGGRAAKS